MARARKDSPAHRQGEQATDIAAFMAFTEKLFSDLPDEVFEALPEDLAINFEHYMYGLPKQQP